MNSLKTKLAKTAKQADRNFRRIRRDKLQASVMATALLQAGIEQRTAPTTEALRMALESNVKLSIALDPEMAIKLPLVASCDVMEPATGADLTIRHASGDEGPLHRYYAAEMEMNEIVDVDNVADEAAHNMEARSSISLSEAIAARYVDEPMD